MSTRSGFHRLLLVVAILYTAFIIYGSFVPLNFTPLPVETAWHRFSQFLELGVKVRSDWFANIVLFIPLAMLWLGALSGNTRARSGMLIWALVVLLGALGLGVCIEFVQLFFPPRVTSRFDVLAQLIGTIIGVGAWAPCRAPLFRGYQLWHEAPPGRQKLRLLLIIYLVVFVAYNVMPLDVTISPADLYHKWQKGLIVLNPFRLDNIDWAENLYELGADILIWVPPAVLLALEGMRSTARVLALVLAGAVAVELLQLLVYSRFTDSRDVLTALLGGVLGVVGVGTAKLLGIVQVGEVAPDSRRTSSAGASTLLSFAAAWFAVLLFVFWFPFEFVFDPRFVAPRLEAFINVPLSAYHAGSEYLAITQVARKALFFLPLGLLFGLLKRSKLIVVAATAAVAVVVELGQVFLPGKTLDLADIAFATLGGFFGYLILGQIKPLPAAVTRGTDAAADAVEGAINAHHATHHGTRLLTPYVLFIAVSAVAAGAIAGAGALPYNVRELFPADGTAFAGGALACALSLIVAVPVGLAFWLQRGGLASRLVLYPLLALGLGAVIWLVLWVSVPMESLHDILGSRILGWPWHWEIMLRFMVLQLPFVVIGTGSAVMLLAVAGGSRSASQATARWLLLALPLLGLAHWVVVTQATTDNLTELMDGGGSLWSSLALGAWIFVCTVSANLAAWTLCQRSFALIALSTLAMLISFPLGYGLLFLGLEDTVLKYGRNFSAIQFLLSPDRDRLVYGLALALRYAQFHALWLAALTLLSWPMWRAAKAPTSSVQAASSRAHITAAEVRTRGESEGGYRVVRLHPNELAFLGRLAAHTNTTVSQCLYRILDGESTTLDFPAGTPTSRLDSNDRARSARAEPSRGGDLQSVDVWIPGPRLSHLKALEQRCGKSVSSLIRGAVASFIAELERQRQ